MLVELVGLIAAFSPLPSAAPAQGVISVEDYPPVALANGWQGDVAFDLTVGTDGRVHACTILRSSGHNVLDEATCRIVARRARFAPALDAAGKPMESHYQQHMNWRIGN